MTESLFSLSGRRALITGSSQGIGFALAKGLAASGATIVLNGRDEAKLNTAATALKSEGATVETLAFDTTQHNADPHQQCRDATPHAIGGLPG